MESDSAEVAIEQFLRMLRKRFLLVFLVMIVVGIVATLFTCLFQKNVYEAKSTIIVSSVKNVESGSDALTYNDYTLNVKLVNSYSVLCKTNRVLDQVIAELHLPMTSAQLAEKISVSSAKDTEIIRIAVRDTDPLRAQYITNSLTRIFQKEVTEIMKMDNVQIIDEARLPGAPISPNRPKNIVLGFAAGLIFGLSIALFVELLDRSIKSEEQITDLLGIPVLGSVPRIFDD